MFFKGRTLPLFRLILAFSNEQENLGSVCGSDGRAVASNTRGPLFESQYCILDGHFFTLVCCKNCNVLFEKTKETKKRLGLPIFKNKVCL